MEEQLIESGLSKVDKSYTIYRNRKNELRRKLLVRSKEKTNKSTTEMSLLVSTSTKETIIPWEQNRITKALVREARISPSVTQKIFKKVEEKVLNLNFNNISTTLIRELVEN